MSESTTHQPLLNWLLEHFAEISMKRLIEPAPAHGRRRGLVREQKEIAGRIDALLEAVRSGTLKGVQAKVDFWEARQFELARELDGLKDEPVRLHPNLADLYRRKIATFMTCLEARQRTEAVELIRSLVD